MAGIYVHIPFCRSRCIYCDFYSTTRPERYEAYTEALCRELEIRQEYLPENDRYIRTVYLGGGTPSQLPAALLERITDCIYKHYDVSDDAEVTIEANPDDVTDEWLQRLRKLPFNRISMGVQTFDDQKLALLRRRHTGRQACEAVERCRKAGLENISIDLIYGLPGQTEQQWEADVERALQLGVQHLSAYALIYEEGTVLWRMREQHRVQEADEEVSLRMFETLMNRTQADGFEHYEISNFALPGFRSRHNSSYWQGIPYLGCGASAHSFNGLQRQWNAADIDTYICGTAHPQTPWFETETLGTDEQYNEYVITRLRTCDGLDLHRLGERFSPCFVHECLRLAAPHLAGGGLEHTAPSAAAPQGILRLTRQGIFISDTIMSDLLRV